MREPIAKACHSEPAKSPEGPKRGEESPADSRRPIVRGCSRGFLAALYPSGVSPARNDRYTHQRTLYEFGYVKLTVARVTPLPSAMARFGENA